MPGTIGLDLAKVTGVAWVGEPTAGCAGQRPWELWSIELNSRGAVRGAHYFAFQKRMDEVLRDWKPGLVSFEEVTFIGKGKDAYRLNAILCGLVMVRCESFGIPYVAVGVPSLKKFAGHGGATKEQMAAFAREKLFEGGRLFRPFPEAATHDQMDALWAAIWGIDQQTKAAA